jgi:hypothetical protein
MLIQSIRGLNQRFLNRVIRGFSKQRSIPMKPGFPLILCRWNPWMPVFCGNESMPSSVFGGQQKPVFDDEDSACTQKTANTSVYNAHTVRQYSRHNSNE